MQISGEKSGECRIRVIWFRKFSDPKIAETQICNIIELINDAINLNLYRFSKKEINTKVSVNKGVNTYIFAVPVDIIMWINAVFIEISDLLNQGNSTIFITVNSLDGKIKLDVWSTSVSLSSDCISQIVLDKISKRLPESIVFSFAISANKISFSLSIPVLQDHELMDIPSLNIEHSFNKINEIFVNITGDEKSINRIDQESPLILIVDDEEDIRKLLKRVLKKQNIECIEAGDGIEAMDILTQESSIPKRIQAVVSDIRMPRMTGSHLLMAMRNISIDLPFIFFSSNLLENSQLVSFKDKNVFYLTKESGIEELKSIVGKIIALNRKN